MADPLKTHIVSCDGGLNTYESNVLLARPQFNGLAIKLLNFESGKGYRRIKGYEKYKPSATGVTGTDAVVGVAVALNTILRWQKDGSNYRLYKLAPSGTNWTQVGAGTIAISAGKKIRTVKYNFSGSRKLAWVDGTGNARVTDGSTITQLNGTGAPADPAYVARWRNRLCFAGMSATPNIVRLSVPNSDTNFSTSAGSTDINVGDVVVNIASSRDKLIIFCENSIHKLEGTTSDNFIVSPITAELGCLASDSVLEVGGDLVFWSSDGVRVLKATDRNEDFELNPITINIRESIKTAIDTSTISDITGVVIRDKSQFRYFFSSSTATANTTKGITGTMHNMDGDMSSSNSQSMRWEFTELAGINPSCCDSGYINGVEYVIHGGWTAHVYRQESGNDFDGTPIVAVYQSPFMDMEDPLVRKKIYKALLYLSLTSSIKAYVALRYNYDDTSLIQPGEHKIDVTFAQAVYDDPNTIFDDPDTQFDTATSPVYTVNTEGSGQTVSLLFVSVDSQGDFGIEGFALEYGNEGRR